MAATVQLPIRSNAGDLWETAVADLSEQDKAALNFDCTDKLEAIAQSLELANNAADICKKQAWRFRRSSGQEVIARDVFAKVARWISHFKDVGDTIVQYDPTHAALPWAGVRFVIQVCVDYFETHDFLLEKISQIAEQICRCGLIERHLLRSSSPTVDEVKRALIKLYAAILTFLVQIKTYFQKKTKRQVLESLKHISGRFDAAFQTIVIAEKDMEHCLQMAIAQQLLDGFTTLTNGLAELQTPMTRWSDELMKITDGLDRSRRAAILKWISSEPHLKYHKRERETFLEGTGSWLVSHPVFQRWKDESASSLLWLHGIPGSGKSKLTSLVIEDALEAFQKEQAPSPAYFYCSRNPAEPGRSDPEKILASIVRQLSSLGPGKPLLPPTVTAYETQEDEGFPIDSLQLQDSYDLLLEILGSYPTATIIIDALDECNPQTRQKLLDTLEGILRRSPTLVKIFVSSRDDQDIKYSLQDYPTLELSSVLNSEDINRFVKCETELLIKQGKLLLASSRKHELSQVIMRKVSSKAHGMFRWASLQLAAICDLVTDRAIIERLGRLPPTLEGLYEEILSKVQQYRSKADRVYARNALAWLLCSRKRLKSNEFLTAISTTDQSSEPLNKDQVLRLCCNLVIFDSTVDGFRFAHLSVREFLESQPAYCTSVINSIAAQFCLTTLTTYAEKNFMYSYANWFWAPHCEAAADERESGPLQVLLEGFLSNTDPQSPFSAWNQCEIDGLGDWVLYEKLVDIQSNKPRSLVVASLFNFVEIVKTEMQQEIKSGTLYHYATLSVSHGAIRTLEVFLALNEFIVTEDMMIAAAGNTHSGREITALLLKKCDQVKITEGIVVATVNNLPTGIEVLTLLLKKCNRIKITDGMVELATRNWSARKVVMPLLLEKCNPVEITEGMVEATTGNWSTGKEVMTLLLKNCDQVRITKTMVRAIANNWAIGKEALTLLLDRRGSQIEITEEAVKSAVSKKKTEIMALLFKKKSDQINATDLIQLEARNWDNKLIALFLEKKSGEIKTRDLVNFAARNWNNKVMVQLIGKKGDQIEITDLVQVAASDWDNKLMARLLELEGGQIHITEEVVKVAANNWNSEIMGLLLEKGIPIAITREVVKVAAGNPNSKVIALLLEKDSQVEITEEVIKVAAGNSNGKIMAMLLERAGQAAITPAVFEAAAINWNSEITALLLQKSGHVAIMEHVMKAAASNPNSEIIALLLDKSNQVEITEEVLKAAASNPKPRAMALLLEKGTQVEITGDVVSMAERRWYEKDMAWLRRESGRTGSGR